MWPNRTTRAPGATAVDAGPDRGLELGQPVERQRDVELVGDADRVDRLGVALPVAPEPAAGRVRRWRPRTRAPPARTRRSRPSCSTSASTSPVALRALGEHDDGAGRGERRREAEVVADELDPVGEADLERDERVERPAQTASRPTAASARSSSASSTTTRSVRCGTRRRCTRVMTRERAFAPGEQPVPVVAGVVLAQRGHPADDAAVGERRLDAR